MTRGRITRRSFCETASATIAVSAIAAVVPCAVAASGSTFDAKGYIAALRGIGLTVTPCESDQSFFIGDMDSPSGFGDEFCDINVRFKANKADHPGWVGQVRAALEDERAQETQQLTALIAATIEDFEAHNYGVVLDVVDGKSEGLCLLHPSGLRPRRPAIDFPNQMERHRTLHAFSKDQRRQNVLDAYLIKTGRVRYHGRPA